MRHWVITEPLTTQLFELMQRAYDHHRYASAFRYVYDFDEWVSFMENDRIIKIVATVDGRLAGLITGTDDLEAIPWISPEYYRNRHPGRNVFHQQDTFVDPEIRNPRVLRALFEEGIRFSAERDAVVSFSVSHELVERKYVALISRVIKARLGTPVVETDAHHYFEFDTRSESASSTTPNRTIAEAI